MFADAALRGQNTAEAVKHIKWFIRIPLSAEIFWLL